MMNCPSCGYPLEGNERYCGMCGTPVDHITKSMDNTRSSYSTTSATGSVAPISPISPSPSKSAPLSPLHPTQRVDIRQTPLDSERSGVVASRGKSKGKLQRTRDRWIAGVIGGVASYLGINPNILRVIYIIICYVLLVSGAGSILLLLVALYIVGIVLMPEEPIDWPNL